MLFLFLILEYPFNGLIFFLTISRLCFFFCLPDKFVLPMSHLMGQAVLLMLCDQPNLSTAELAQLVSVWARHSDQVVASRYGGTFGAPAIFPRAVFPMLEALQGDRGAKPVIEQLAKSILVDVPGAELDIDRPEDLDRLRDSRQ